MKNFYSNVGKKLQVLAKIAGVLGFILIIIGVIVLASDEVAAGIALCGVGLLLVFSSLPLYAFGQITDDVHQITNCTTGAACQIDNDLPDL